MAGIDKTYTSNYKEYQELVEWSRGKAIEFKYGKKTLKIPVANSIYEWDEQDFVSELPVLNTATWEDRFLWDTCPCQFVIDRLRQVYGGNYLETVDLNKIPDNFKTNRKIRVVKDKLTKWPLKNKGISNRHHYWWVQTKDGNDLSYSSKLDAWTVPESFPSDTNTMNGKTIKSIIRRLRKMYLPSGIKFMLIGRYVGEIYTIEIK